MKNLIFWAVIIYICYMLYGSYLDNKENNLARDYLKLEQLKSECEYIAGSNYVNGFGHSTTTWYIMNLNTIHRYGYSPYDVMEEHLGEDFKVNLSNGDMLYIGFLPYTGSFRIYAGGTDDANLLYPEWNYEKLSEPEGFTDK